MQSYFVVARCLALVLWPILENNIVTLGDYSGAFGPVVFYSSHRRVFHVNLGVLCDWFIIAFVIFVWLNYLLPYYHIACGCLSSLGSNRKGKV